jgi:hypothetical protein
MSVGYDLAGITSPTVQAFLDGMADARADRRSPPPPDSRRVRPLPRPRLRRDACRRASRSARSTAARPTRSSGSRHVLRDRGLACVVKLNPMLLGEADTNRLLHDVLGHHDLRVPPSAFTRDTTWPQMCDFSGRLAELAGRSASASASSSPTRSSSRTTARSSPPPSARCTCPASRCTCWPSSSCAACAPPSARRSRCRSRPASTR